MITCREMVPMLRALLDHELPPEEAAVPEEHLAGCPACRSLAGAYQGIRTLSAELALAAPPPGWRERLRQALLERPPAPAPEGEPAPAIEAPAPPPAAAGRNGGGGGGDGGASGRSGGTSGSGGREGGPPQY